MIFHATYIIIFFFRIVNSFRQKENTCEIHWIFGISVQDGKQPKIVDIYAVMILGMKLNLH